ncbi:LD-carboxypeptidase [Balneola sp. MJW-20]|uniref:S66 peptidase family protein n=1 Tax=Gracilimonas aurantiaca TaxID=3234185 RepID=UPI003466EDC9
MAILNTCDQKIGDHPKYELLKPNSIDFTSNLGLVAPASPIYLKSDFDKMITNLNDLGFTLKRGKYVEEKNGYLAGSDEQRAEDLMNMFRDKEIDAIMCIRGGWGSNRILSMIDYDLIRSNPKPLIGFSDITSLHMAIYKKSSMVTYHGPVGKSVWTPYSINSFESTLIKGDKTRYSVIDDQKYTIQAGEASGVLLGGNLSVLCSLIGSEYLPDFSGAILFVEDIGESVYRIDRMLMQLKMAGILNAISGFIFGKCTECDAGPNSLKLNEVLEHYIKPLQIPAFYGAMISHEDDNATIPVGIEAVMNSSDCTISLTEAAVA